MTQLVLLAEEDLVLRELFARALRSHGYHVIAVRDGLGLCDYLELARFSHGRAPNPDVIISDSELSGYGGASICELLSHEQASIPFILLGNGESSDSSGATLILQKPVNLNALVDAVAACAGQSPAAEAASAP